MKALAIIFTLAMCWIGLILQAAGNDWGLACLIIALITVRALQRHDRRTAEN